MKLKYQNTKWNVGSAKNCDDVRLFLEQRARSLQPKYSYYKLAYGGYMVCRNDEPIWEVVTRKQAIQDCKELECQE